MCVALCALLLPALCAGFSRAPAAFGPAQRSHANAQRAPVAMRAPSRADDVDDDDDDDDDARPPFNFDRSVELASLAFHTYVPVTDGKWERGSDQTNVAFQRASFVSECYDGVLIVNLKRVRGLPKDAQQAGAGEALLTGGALDPYVQLSIVEGRKVPGRDDADAAARDVFRSETRWRMGEGDADAAGAAGGAAARPPGGGAAKARPREQGVAEYDETAYLYVNDLATARLRVTLKDQNVAKEDDLLGAASLGLGGLGLDGGGGAAAERAERVVIKYSAPIGPGMAGGAAAGALFGGPLGAGLGAAAGALGKRWMRDATVEVSLRYLRLGEAAAAVGGLSEAAQAAITASALQLSKADEQELIERALAKAQAAFRAARAGGVSADAAAAAAAPVAPAGVAGAVPARASESSAPAGIDWAQLGKAALRAERSEADGGAGVAADDASAEGGGGGSAEAAAAAKLALSADEEEDMIARAVARAQAAYLAARGESAPKATPVAPPAAARPSAAASPALATASLPQPAAAPFNPDALGGTAGIDWTELGTAAVNPRRFELIAYIDNADTDTQATLWRDAKARELVLSFRGTEQTAWKDLLIDAMVLQQPWSIGGADAGSAALDPRVHSGFKKAWASVAPRVRELLAGAVGARAADPGARARALRRARWTLYCTGHSLGGALATLAALELGQSALPFKKIGLYSYGAPRVGNADLCALVDSYVPEAFRIVNGQDLVTRMPRGAAAETLGAIAGGILDYRHPGRTVLVDEREPLCAVAGAGLERECPLELLDSPFADPLATRAGSARLDGARATDVDVDADGVPDARMLPSLASFLEGALGDSAAGKGVGGAGGAASEAFGAVQRAAGQVAGQLSERMSKGVSLKDVAALVGIQGKFVEAELALLQSITSGVALAHHLEPSYYAAMRNAQTAVNSGQDPQGRKRGQGGAEPPESGAQ